MSIWGGFRKRERTLTEGLFAFGAFAIGMGLTKNFILYLFLMFFYGIALTAAQTSITTLLQEKSEPAMHGRVFGLFSTMYAGFLPLGMLLFGPLADLVPLQWLMAGSGAALISHCGNHRSPTEVPEYMKLAGIYVFLSYILNECILTSPTAHYIINTYQTYVRM